MLTKYLAVFNLAISAAQRCRFAPDYQCSDFSDDAYIKSYMEKVMDWEGKFASPGVGYDPSTGHSYDGHPLDYNTGELYGEPHLFSAPSKESIHLSVLSLAIGGNEYALRFAGGFDAAIDMLELKMSGYEQFNKTYPGYGCFTPWIGFNTEAGTFDPLESWSTPYYKVPGLDNGEWFWALYSTVVALNKLGSKYADLAGRYTDYLNCQKNSAKSIFYRGNGDVSAEVYILDASITPVPSNYEHCSGYLNDPYEGETMTQLLYLFSDWEGDEEGREALWTTKRNLLQAVNYTIPSDYIAKTKAKTTDGVITVQKGFWFSTHEQWKALLMPYLAEELPLVRRIFSNCEKARVIDAYTSALPGLLASVNDVTNGSEEIPDYASACGIASISYQEIQRRDLMTPYGSFGLFLQDMSVGLCWYDNMLDGPRMQGKYGSTEAINANGTEISPVVTWDSKITTVLAMLGGVGELVKEGLLQEKDKTKGGYASLYHRFVAVVNREYELAFGGIEQVLGSEVEWALPSSRVPSTELSDWKLDC